MKTYWRTIGSIAANTYKETVRDRVLYALVAFAGLTIVASLLAGSVSLGQDVRVIESFGLTAMLIFLLIITLFVGTQSVFREVERKTIYLTLSKPVSRDQFFIGKFLGICATITISAVTMGIVLLIIIYQKERTFSVATIWATLFLLFEAWLVTAIGLLFATFSSPVASAIYTFCIVLIGHSTSSIWQIAQKSGSVVKWILVAVYYVFPNLEKFDLRNTVVYSLHPAATQVLTASAYFVVYALLVLVLGLMAFRYDEF